MDLAGRSYWDAFWGHQSGRRFGQLSYFHRRMSKLLLKHAAPSATVCEIGCGASVWMPLLARHGATVWGIDYSDRGLALAEGLLRRAGATARLVRGDVLRADTLPPGFFDMVFSLGFVEHFDDPSLILERFSKILKPGGALITLVPNFTGVWGRVQRRVDPEVYAVHRVYSPDALDAIHRAAGFATVEAANYFGGFGPLVVNYERALARLPRTVATVTLGATWSMQQIVAWSTSVIPALRDSRLWASHLVGVYRRPLPQSHG
jgi:SAM-dependent methyltransferase